MIVRILLLPLKNDSISIFKAEDSLLPVISPASLAKKKKKTPFLVSNTITVGRQLNKGEVYYYFGASHSIEGRNSIYCNLRLKHFR